MSYVLPADPCSEILNIFYSLKINLSPKLRKLIDKNEGEDDVDYVKLTIFDSNGRIFRNLLWNVFHQKLLNFTLESNGKYDLEKLLFIKFFE